MKLHHFAFTALVLVGLSVTGARAEPGPKVNLLMDTPTSLFSFGMYRTDELLRSMMGPDSPLQLQFPLSGTKFYSANVYYDWDKNRVILHVMDFADPDAGWDQEAECAQVIKAVRNRGGVDTSTGVVFPVFNGRSIYASQFLPLGYGQAKLDGAAEALDGIIEVHFQSGASKPFMCTAPLLGTTYSVQR